MFNIAFTFLFSKAVTAAGCTIKLVIKSVEVLVAAGSLEVHQVSYQHDLDILMSLSPAKLFIEVANGFNNTAVC